MPETKKYKIIDHDSGISHVVALGKPPTEEDAARIIDSFRQDKINKEKEEGNRSLFSKEGFLPRLAELVHAPSEAIAPQGMAQEDVEKLPIHQRVGRLAQETASGLISPEGLALLGTAATGPLGMAGASIVGGGQMLMNAPETVQQALEHPSIETIGRAGILGAGLIGAGEGLGKGVTGFGAREGFVAPRPSLRDVMEEQRGVLNQQAVDKAANTSRLPAVRPPTPIIDAEFVDPIKATYRDVPVQPPTPPEQLTGGQLQIGPGRIIEAPGTIADTDYVRGITPKEVKGTAAKKGVRATKKTLSSHEGEHTPVVPEEVQNVPDEVKNITPGPTSKEKIEGINKEKVTEINEPPAKPKAEEKPLEKIENSWIREQETSVLKQMLPGSRGQMAREINTVLNERGAFPKEKVIEVSKETPAPAPKTEVVPKKVEPKVESKKETPAPKVPKAETKVETKIETPIDENSPEAKKARQQEHVKNFYESKKTQEAKNMENDFSSSLERSIEQRKAKKAKINEIKVKSPLEPQKSGIDFVVDEIEKKFPGAMNSEDGIRKVVDSRMGDYTPAQKEQIIGELLKHRKMGTEGFEEKSQLNEASFNKYQELLNDLINHGEKVGHLVLRDIVQHGKDAGLDQETIVNDLIDNAHPETNSLSNKAWNAAKKVFNPEPEE